MPISEIGFTAPVMSLTIDGDRHAIDQSVASTFNLVEPSVNVIHALEHIRSSIFLAGPTPRDNQTPTWRKEALLILKRLNFDGDVFVPEGHDWAMHGDYDHQIAWEWLAMSQATCIAFWIPRELVSMPAFTTNVEFGQYVASGKCILGFPPSTPKMRYLEKLGASRNVQICETLEETMHAATAMCAYRRILSMRR